MIWMRYEQRQDSLWKILKSFTLQEHAKEDDIHILHKWMNGKKLRYGLFLLLDDEREKQILFLQKYDLQNRAIILPFEECAPSLGHEYFVPDESKKHQNALRNHLFLQEGPHYVLIDMTNQRVICKSAGRYLVYDINCSHFPWDFNARKFLQRDFVSVAELSDIDSLDHIPRTCFLFGNEARITNLTIPVIDHMRQIMATVTLNSFF